MNNPKLCFGAEFFERDVNGPPPKRDSDLPSHTFSSATCSLLQQAVHFTGQLKTPLFLRFINMMINDATVQLDEGLSVRTCTFVMCLLHSWSLVPQCTE